MLEKIYDKHIVKLLILAFLLQILTLGSIVNLALKIKNMETETLIPELIMDGETNDSQNIEIDYINKILSETEERILAKVDEINILDNDKNNIELADFQNVLSDSEKRIVAKIENNVVNQEDVKRWIDEALNEKITTDNKNFNTKMEEMNSSIEGKLKEIEDIIKNKGVEE